MGLFNKSASWWFGKNSVFAQIMPNEQSVSIGGMTLSTKQDSADNITNITNEGSSSSLPDIAGFNINEFINDPNVRKYGPYILAYIFLRR